MKFTEFKKKKKGKSYKKNMGSLKKKTKHPLRDLINDLFKNKYVLFYVEYFFKGSEGFEGF